MKVEIFRRTVKDRRRGNSYELLYHLKEGIEASGDEAVIVHENRSGPTVKGEMEPTAPMAAMFGYGGDKQMHHTKGRRRELADNCRAKKIPLITFDGGLLSSFGNVSTSPDHHFRVSLYTPMNDGNFLSDNSPSDRWQMLVDKFHVKYEPWRKSNTEDPILFGLQPKDNWSMNELDPIDWFNDVYKKLRPITKRKFIVRPHPNNVSNILERRKELPTDIELQYTQKNFVGDEKKHYRFNFQDALNNCHAFVTHNSTASVDSCIRGVPTFVTSDLALCWPVANKDLTRIESPEYPSRTQWVNDLGYKMWSIKEIRDGTVYKRFKQKLGL
jgi:hypothetical protein|tara:strand:+ start:8797 stop:9780 length:984 start_codon:yes stop_codon:yes gene_type:complete